MPITLSFLFDFVISFAILRSSLLGAPLFYSNFFLRAAGTTLQYLADQFQFLSNRFMQFQHKVKLAACVSVYVF